ncbi:MAG: sugar ABC transporter ATP-binding protein [Pirellulaceae bacterium]
MLPQKLILHVQNLTKRFPGVVALNNVKLELHEGEFLALIGENGAGKSTLMKILAGVQLQDEGTVEVFGETVRMDSVKTAQHHGIALIHQELNLSENLSIAANIFLGREPAKAGFIDKATIRCEAQRFLDMVGLKIDSETLAGDLSIGQQQLVEIAKALSIDARILIMDEPTSSLSAGESERLFEVIAELRERGVSIIYISHRLGEVKMLSDRVTVFRDGQYAGDLCGEEITHDAMVKRMVGRDISQYYSHEPNPIGDVILEVSNLRTQANPEHELSFKVHEGEIVGISGLVGAGRTELLDALFGVAPAISGTIAVAGQQVELNSPSDAIALGLALVPEDRKGQGLVLQMSVKENTSMASLKAHSINGIFRNAEREAQDTDEMIARLSTKTPHADQTAGFLSGGNQQKVVLGKWLATSPTLLLLDEPTRGIDIGAKQEIYQLMEELASQGMAVLFVSSELEEIIGMSDRTIVMHEGKITGELRREDLAEESIMHLATGGVQH